jgi:magnesium transporter
MTPDQTHFEEVLEGISRGSTSEIKVLMASLRPSEVASVIEANTPDTRRIIWGLLDEEVRNQSLQYLQDDVRAEFLEAMDTAQLVAVAENLDTDDFADILQQLPDTITNQVLGSLDSRDRARVESVLSYPEDSAGGLMNTDTITVRPRHAAELVLRYLRPAQRPARNHGLFDRC